MRPLSDLLDASEPALPALHSRIAAASCSVEILEREQPAGEAALLALQVTTRSFLGAVAYETGGLLLDRGWLRVLGAGCPRFARSIRAWNGLDGERRFASGLLVADDAIGGFFAWMSASQTIAYFAPDSLAWDDLGLGYQAWLERMLTGLAPFYEMLRWPGWENEVASLSPNAVLHFYPPLWTKESRPLERASRRAISIDEAWSLAIG